MAAAAVFAGFFAVVDLPAAAGAGFCFLPGAAAAFFFCSAAVSAAGAFWSLEEGALALGVEGFCCLLVVEELLGVDIVRAINPAFVAD
ncbi:MAG: hypothetical protein GX174_07585 [Lentisphaerae bacterium]|nr:hypothetical protein [Lentisphaerota bacterium]